MKTHDLETLQHNFPRVLFMPDQAGEDDCPDCHTRGTKTQRNMATLSPSDDNEVICETCEGEGVIIVKEPE